MSSRGKSIWRTSAGEAYSISRDRARRATPEHFGACPDDAEALIERGILAAADMRRDKLRCVSPETLVLLLLAIGDNMGLFYS